MPVCHNPAFQRLLRVLTSASMGGAALADMPGRCMCIQPSTASSAQHPSEHAGRDRMYLYSVGKDPNGHTLSKFIVTVTVSTNLQVAAPQRHPMVEPKTWPGQTGAPHCSAYWGQLGGTSRYLARAVLTRDPSTNRQGGPSMEPAVRLHAGPGACRLEVGIFRVRTEPHSLGPSMSAPNLQHLFPQPFVSEQSVAP